jgi:hypothetical protein
MTLLPCFERLSPHEAAAVEKVHGFVLAPDAAEGLYRVVEHDALPARVNRLVAAATRLQPPVLYLCRSWERRTVPSQVRPGKRPDTIRERYEALRANVEPALAEVVERLWWPIQWADRNRHGVLVACAWSGEQPVAALSGRVQVAEGASAHG